MAISQSFHIGTGNHNIANGAKLSSVSKHNERLFAKDRHNPRVYNFYEGTINDNVRKIYRDVFQSYVDEYNAHQKRADRRIDDYFTYIGNDKRQNVATEIILQYGTKEFWEQHPEWKTTDREQIMAFFRSQINELDKCTSDMLKNVPGAKLNVAQGTLHFDEASPHLHIIAVPSMPSKRHVKLQPNKSLFFANERLEKIHDHLRDKANLFFEEKYKTQVVKLDEPQRSYVEISEYKNQKELAKHLYMDNVKLAEQIDEKTKKNKILKSEIKNQELKINEQDNYIKNFKDRINENELKIQEQENTITSFIEEIEEKELKINELQKTVDELEIKKSETMMTIDELLDSQDAIVHKINNLEVDFMNYSAAKTNAEKIGLKVMNKLFDTTNWISREILDDVKERLLNSFEARELTDSINRVKRLNSRSRDEWER